MKKFLLCMMFVALMCGEAFSRSGPILAFQPAYNFIRFYMYRPDNVPKNFYATYDGYLIYRNKKGVWFYASAEQNGIMKTNYIVGSVVPSTMVEIKPLNSSISSVSPVLGTNNVTNTPYVTTSQTRAAYVPPSTNTAIFSPTFSELGQNANFMAIGKWKNSVDRIGIIDRPSAPAAWKGTAPEAIYIWTGRKWMQLTARGKNITAISTIRRGLYDFTKTAAKDNALQWSANDTLLLQDYAKQWGYKWLGTIATGRDDL